MKYIDAEKLKELLDAKYKEFREKGYREDATYYYFADGLDVAEQLVDSLQQEQPDVNFKVKERKWVHDAVDNVFPEDGDFMSEVDFRKIIKDTALYFYRFGLKARKGEQEQQEVNLEEFTEKMDAWKARFNHPDDIPIKATMAFTARMFYMYPDVARQWYEQLPKATMD